MFDFIYVFPGSGIVFDLVLIAIEQRKAKMTPLTRLHIDRCTVNAEKAAALEEVIPDLWWDARDHDGGDEDEDEMRITRETRTRMRQMRPITTMTTMIARTTRKL